MNDKSIFEENKTSRHETGIKTLFKDMLRDMSVPEMEEFAKAQLNIFRKDEIGKLIHKYGEIEVLGIILLNIQKIPGVGRSNQTYLDAAIKGVNEAINNLRDLQESWETM